MQFSLGVFDNRTASIKMAGLGLDCGKSSPETICENIYANQND